MQDLYLVKVGEISLKGKNRSFFEGKLLSQIRRRLQGLPATVNGKNGRFYLSIETTHRGLAEEVLRTTFGVVAFSRCLKVKKELSAIESAAVELAGEHGVEGETRFKIEVRRTDKGFSMNSYEIACHLGELLLGRYPGMRVDVKAPDWRLHVEVREKVYLYGPEFEGQGGLPVGCAGGGGLLLSGGIDSPVAGYLMAKRGLKLDCIHFHAYPYTSTEAKDKVVDLARILAHYTGGVSLYIVPFTEPQVYIRKHGSSGATTLLIRAAMLDAATMIVREGGGGCLITGEALSQVASQTMESIAFTDRTTSLPIFRPLIGFDKEEVVSIARKIGTFETSTLPFEDCCTIFSPERPLLRPDAQRLLDEYRELALGEQVDSAVRSAERVTLHPDGGIQV